MKAFFKEFLKDIPVDILAGALIAIGLYNFASASAFPMTGVSGIALILYQLFGLPIGTLTILMNIPIALFTYRTLGREFFIRSVKSMIISSLLTDYVAPYFPVYQGDLMLSAICCSVFTGIGYALIFMRGSSTGGMDFVSVAVRRKFPFISLGRITFTGDLLVITAGWWFVSRNIESLIYGVIISYMVSIIIDKLMYGISEGKVALIVTNLAPDICKKISEEYDRGATILKATGGFTGEDRQVVMCACNTKQMYGIRRMVKAIDPKSFTMIMESSDVVGEGFRAE